ncbi:MAG TPA: protease pro-enzyme activation domain-containing protein [Candidatus Sulfotelmatobacter sp.]|nr:protease pro-enzyme activation domain-containing protein [Candidatus Sulfotelmatobacter sp.]
MKVFCASTPKQPLAVTLAAILLISCALALVQRSSAQQSASVAPSPLITQPVDESQLTVLRGNTYPLARPQFDLGTAPATLPMQRMLLVLKRSPQQEHALRTLLDNQQDKNSANYHQWLTPEQYGTQFGPTDADMQVITGWLQSHGFQLGTPSKGRTLIEFSGSASQVQEAFHTTIHKYLVNGEQHWANSSDPSIPTALTPAVAGVFTLHDFLRKPHYRLSKDKGTFTPGRRPQITFTDGSHGLAPGDYAVIYNINPVYNATPTPIDGTGISIGVVGRSDIILQDITDFRTMFGINGPTPQVIVNGPDPGDVPGDDVEATLDVTWSGAVAPGAQVLFVNSSVTNTTDGVTLSEIYIVDNNLSNIMTYSFGGCEAKFGADAALDLSLAEQAAAQGISFFASTGDAGAEGCDDPNFETVATGPLSVNLPSSTPFTTAVGGTEFNDTPASTYWSPTNSSTGASALSYIPEVVWNDSCPESTCGANANIAAGGGGESTGDLSQGGSFAGFPRPSYQSGVTGIPPVADNDNQRDTPDVSLSASGHDGYVLCFQASCESGFIDIIGGTSASSPSFAGIMALVDQKMSLAAAPDNSPRQGLANYVLYPLASAQENAGTACNASTTPALLATSGCVFNDVTVGNNAVPDTSFTSTLYQAVTGYDQGSGLGSVNVANLVNNWSSVTFRPTTTSLKLNSGTTTVTVTHGTPVNVSVTVAPSNGTGTPAGDVSLLAAVGIAPPNGVSQTSVGGFTLTNGSTAAGSTTAILPGGGPYAVTAHYAGNSTSTATGVFAPSDSNAVMVKVTPENSTTTMSGVDPNNNPIAGGNNTFPFGTPLFVRVQVAGISDQGVPTGQVHFTDTFGGLPLQVSGYAPVANPVSLNSQGTASIGGGSVDFLGVFNYDAGNHSISGSYAGDASFNSSSSSQPVAFTIQPGFTAVSGLASVTIAAPGGSGATTLGIIASTGFTTAIAVTCTGLPAGAACTPTSITGNGPNNIVTGTITVTTTAPAAAMLQPVQRPFYFAMLAAAAMPFGGILLLAVRRKRNYATLLGLLVLALIIGLPACGGGGGGGSTPPPPPPPNTGTPAGTYSINVNVAAGSISGSVGSFTLTVQ